MRYMRDYREATLRPVALVVLLASGRLIGCSNESPLPCASPCSGSPEQVNGVDVGVKCTPECPGDEWARNDDCGENEAKKFNATSDSTLASVIAEAQPG